jgi:hypothetical protein
VATKCDPIDEIKKLFEAHNRDALVNKKGRIIQIPEINIKREDLFLED